MRSSLISAVALLCLSTGAFAQAAQKVAVVSIQTAIAATKDGRKASQDLEAKFNPKKQELDTEGSQITQLQDQLTKGGALMSEDKKEELQRDIDTKKRAYQKHAQDAQDSFEETRQQLLTPIGQRMMAVIENYAKQNGYSVVLDASNPNNGILYASTAADITQDIVNLYDAKSVNGGPAPAAGAPAPAAGTAKPSGLK